MMVAGAGVGLSSACSDAFESCQESATCSEASGGGGGEGGGGEGASAAASAANGGDAGAAAGAAPGGTGGATAGNAGATGMGNQAGDAGAGGAGPSCDLTGNPRLESCLVTDERAVFVSPEGDDDNPGTQAAPLATLTAAAELANGKKVVLVCNAIYQQEHVSITNTARVYGGFRCSDWSVDAKRPTFAPITVGPALSIKAVADAVLIDQVNFQVGDAAVPGESAVAALVTDSANVTLQSVLLKAGKGRAAGAAVQNNFPFAEAGALAGFSESLGGSAKVCACQGLLQSAGGAGGAKVPSGAAGLPGTPALAGGQGGAVEPNDCGNGSSGKKGSDAAAAPAATKLISLGKASSEGWASAPGVSGEPGSPGQGGGGGASLNDSGHGGGGGCGGCGGNGGPGGAGGGASIALVVNASTISLNACALVANDAGDGGSGAVGQPGQQVVGVGGSSLSIINSCNGGNGGKGGHGGAGGGGAGGISVSVVWRGASAPTLSADTTTAFGKAGAKGLGGVPGTNDGPDGVAQAVWQSID